MAEHSGHAHGCHFRDDGVVVAELEVWEDALHAVSDAVADTEAFGDDGGEVGELFELGPGWGAADSGCQVTDFGGEAVVDGGIAEDVEG